MTTRLKCLVPTLVVTTPRGWKSDAVRGNRHQRGYGAAWERTRHRILERDNHLCQCETCTATGRTTVANEVDHRIPKAQGGSDDDSNLQAINHECHKAKTARESRNPGGEGL